jgi:hypothetical protein
MVRIAYGLAVCIQIALLAGSYQLQVLSKERMMVMRYLVAKNLAAEEFWFSPASLATQRYAFALAFVGLACAGARALVRAERFLGVQLLVGAALAGLGAYLAWGLDAETTRGLYAMLAAVLGALAIQIAVLSVVYTRSS